LTFDPQNLTRSSVWTVNIPCQFYQNGSSRSRDIMVTISDQTNERMGQHKNMMPLSTLSDCKIVKTLKSHLKIQLKWKNQHYKSRKCVAILRVYHVFVPQMQRYLSLSACSCCCSCCRQLSSAPCLFRDAMMALCSSIWDCSCCIFIAPVCITTQLSVLRCSNGINNRSILTYTTSDSAVIADYICLTLLHTVFKKRNTWPVIGKCIPIFNILSSTKS